MKIVQFDPLARPEARRPAASASSAPKEERGQSFEAEIRKAGARAALVIDKISSENHLAIEGATMKGVGEARSLLSSLLADVRSSSAEALQKVHNMDGILYYFQP
jgi:hypothetical protein